jgi:DNA-binding NtrC family response regulator
MMSTILVVDDCSDTSDLYGLVLMSRGHTVLVATSIQKAVEMAYTHKGAIDLLLTDLFLGDGMGCELPYLLGKRMPKSAILVTGKDPLPSSRYTGFDDYLIKPVDIDEMVRTVESCIKLHQEQEQEAVA